MIPIVLCPWCLAQIIILSVVVIPVLWFLGKICKIGWADRYYTSLIKKIKSMAESMKIIKKEEKEDEPPCSACKVSDCDKRRK